MPARWPRGLGLPNGLLTEWRTDLIDTALARGWPLDGVCPHPACELGGNVCEAVTADQSYVTDTVVVYEFHPCGHRFSPQWRVPTRKANPYLDQPVSRPRKRRWLAALKAKAVRP